MVSNDIGGGLAGPPEGPRQAQQTSPAYRAAYEACMASYPNAFARRLSYLEDVQRRAQSRAARLGDRR